MKKLLFSTMCLLLASSLFAVVVAVDIFGAVKQGNRALVRRLLDKNPELVLKTDDHAMTPFLLAVSKKDLEMVKLLAQKSSRLTARGEKGNAFHIATANQDEQMIKLLAKLAQTKEPSLPRQMLNYQRNIYVSTSYYSNDKSSPLHIAAQKCNRRIYNYFVSLGADEKLTDSLGKTPLEIISNCEKTRRQIQKQKEITAARERASARMPKDDGI